ncbi:ABC transporter [bacterium (Candidatus Torokbacteria) CG_4_10_14_0_2_um_filter_35_8]|nr:MAG: ABC transporter [bacterium (Candidatus Torokbacteria) CG_4_10_14_0_2_um_filter_35_8]
MPEVALKVKNLRKVYGELVAVNDISFKVQKGEVFGILGPNGAGKTTALEIIEGLRKKTKGRIEVLGKNLKESSKKGIQERIGIQLQSSSYFDYLNLYELLDLFGSFYPKRLRPNNLLRQVGLESKRKQFTRNLSGGQQQRFSVVASLVNNPDLLFLDEPTTGLDPKIRREIWELIRKINEKGKTIILTTHYMEEAQQLCDRVAIMHEGKIVDLDSPQELIDKQNLRFTVKFVAREKVDIKLNDLRKIEIVLEAFKEKNKYVLKITDATKINDILNFLEGNHISFKNLEVLPPTLEDVFLKLTGKKLININENHA